MKAESTESDRKPPRRHLLCIGMAVLAVFVILVILPLVCVGGMYNAFWSVWCQPLFFLKRDIVRPAGWFHNFILSCWSAMLWAALLGTVVGAVLAIRRRWLHASTVIVIHAVFFVLLIVNELPERGTYGSWPPGRGCEMPTPLAHRSSIHRGWPYSFYLSYTSAPDGTTVVECWWSSLTYNVVFAFLILVASATIWEAGRRRFMRR